MFNEDKFPCLLDTNVFVGNRIVYTNPADNTRSTIQVEHFQRPTCQVEQIQKPIDQVELRESQNTTQTNIDPSVQDDASQAETFVEDGLEGSTSLDESDHDYFLSRDRERRVIRPLQRYAYSACTDLLAYGFMIAIELNKEEPTTYQEAISGEDSIKWMAAMKEEMNSLYKNHTWIMVERLKKKSLLLLANGSTSSKKVL